MVDTQRRLNMVDLTRSLMRIPLIPFLAHVHDQLQQAAPDNVNYDSCDELVMCQERN